MNATSAPAYAPVPVNTTAYSPLPPPYAMYPNTNGNPTMHAPPHWVDNSKSNPYIYNNNEQSKFGTCLECCTLVYCCSEISKNFAICCTLCIPLLSLGQN